jgi:hypothetical protein
MDELTPLHGLWARTTLHWSSIRMRNARGWEEVTSQTEPPGRDAPA